MESETKRRLVEAGLLLFGLHGLEATTTRALAQKAGVNLAAIPYHFGGKEGLYRAVLEHIVRIKLKEIAPCLERLRAVCDTPATGREELLQSLREVVRILVLALLDSPESRSCAQIILQEQIAPTAGFGIVHDQFLVQIHTALGDLLGRLLDLPAGSLELYLHTMSFMGQMFIFRVGMPSLLALVGSDRLSEAQVMAIVAVCVRQAEALVAGFGPTPRGSGL
ncbi:MAG: CerR family C-terminal domain-containing protein [Solidesulfovibrio sp. DCME]|uniref:CerR family C-terminal domain-containing protein n=1 Tax=Solidesulfovibrio sp. DCME TaxID=3447380 RepID=UPI003D107C9A